MSQPREPHPAKLVIRFLFSDFGARLRALGDLASNFGPMDFLSMPGDFPYTSYYDDEMGRGLRRQTAAFFNLVSQSTLPDIKLLTNEIEARLLQNGKRQVNIDPGLLSMERLVLATGKNFIHRVYLREGILCRSHPDLQGGSLPAFALDLSGLPRTGIFALSGGNEKETEISAGWDFSAIAPPPLPLGTSPRTYGN